MRLPRLRLRNPVIRFRYRPVDDGRPDPGEVVWAWVPYEEDASRGKDRPVLVIGVEADTVLALAMTSKDHDRDAEQEASAGRHWMDVGSGPWDSRRRPSEVRLDRLLRLRLEGVRREGGALPAEIFRAVTAAAAPHLDATGPDSTDHEAQLDGPPGSTERTTGRD